MLPDTLVQEITELHANFCSALSDPTRLMLLYTLANQPCNVTELTRALDLPQPTISRHLKILRERGLVAHTRQGNSVQYSLSDPRIIQALDLLRSIMRDHVQFHASLVGEE